MTTATPRRATAGGLSVRALAFVVAAGCVLLVVGLLGGGWSAAAGVLLATAIVTLFFALGAFFLFVIGQMTPQVSMLLALMTFGLQVLLIAVAFLVVERAEVFSDRADVLWFGCSVIVLTMVWMVAQLSLTTKLRIPAYDLDQDQAPQVSDEPEESAR